MSSAIAAASLGIIVVVATVRVSWSDGREIWASLVVLALATALGWLVGLAVSPYVGEQQQFTEYAKAVGAGLGGFLLGKVDGLVTQIMKSEVTPALIVRYTGSLAVFIVSILVVYYFRKYAG